MSFTENLKTKDFEIQTHSGFISIEPIKIINEQIDEFLSELNESTNYFFQIDKSVKAD